MNKQKLRTTILLVVLLLFTQVAAWADTAPVPTVTQTLNLDPGWNAVYVEVQPAANTPATVFSALPQGSTVWAWTGKDSPVQFIQDPNEAAVYKPKWLNISTAPTEASLNSLYAIKANTPYLVRVAGNAPVSVAILGRPTIRHKSWVPDSFNLTGFSFSATPPTFATFFAQSASHEKQAVYRLNGVTGIWEMVNSSTAHMRSGEAFWVYCLSGSDYQGPLSVTTGGSDGLDFGIGITTLSLTISNAPNLDRPISNSPNVDRTVSVAQLNNGSAVALAYRYYDVPSGKILSIPLSGMPPVVVKVGGSAVVNLAVIRENSASQAAAVLELSDAHGDLIRVPVTVTSNGSNSYAGLWTGVASLNKVSQLVDSGSAPNFASGEAKPTPAALNLNLILHQDKNGQLRLLKQVIIMYENGTQNLDGTPRTKGRYVALTQDELISKYSGVTQRDGSKVGRRLSAIGFDYSPAAGEFGTDDGGTALKCSGSISTTIQCKPVLESSSAGTHPTNPFLHKYHPDHDNLAGDYKTFSQEVNRIERDVLLEFDSVPRNNPTNPPLGWGITVLGGTYTEQIRGLAKGPIKIQGDFTVNLATDVDLLNE